MHKFPAFKHRDFRLYSIGLLISRIGNEMQKVALHWQMYLLTKSAFAMGMMGLATVLPLLIFAFVGGITADKFNRKKIILSVQTVQLVISTILTIATYLHLMTPALIYASVAILAITWAFDSPARQSIIPHLLPKEDYPNGVSINGTLWQVAVFIGPAIGGLIIDYFGVPIVHVLNTLSFIPILISVFLIASPKQIVNATTTFSIQSVLEGIHFIRKTPALYATILLDFFATFFASGTTLMPIFAAEIFKMGAKGLGLLYAAPAIGGIIGSIIFSHFSHINKQGKVLVYSVIIFGIATIFFGLTHIFSVALFFLAITGAMDIVSTIIRQTLRQMITPDHMRGRMSGVTMLFNFGGPYLGEVEAGIAATAFGAPMAVVIGGVGTIISALALTKIFPQLYKYKNHHDHGI